MHRAALRATLAAGLSLVTSAAAGQVAVPQGFQHATVVSSIPSGTAMAFAPDGRLFVCQQTGAVRVIKQGQLLATPFVSLSVDSQGERGLLGLAFDPAFASNHYLYVYYTALTSPRRNRVSRFTANGDVAAAGSELVILELENLSGATNHNGGGLAFGPDGALYVAVGENANPANSQTLANRLGKILRINTDGSLPTDNPFYTSASGVNRAIWALGLRNPFTFAFEEGSGRMLINDVGAGTFEEVNQGIAGANYGWPASEGPTGTSGHIGPVYWYGHSQGSNPRGCAISGGVFYPAAAAGFPSSYAGDYFFADYCAGFIRRLDAATGTTSPFASGLSSPVDLDVGPDGRLYYLSRGGGGVIGRISYGVLQVSGLTPSPAPPFVNPNPITWTATLGPGAPQNVEYQFWRYSQATGAWTSEPYSSSNSYVFTPNGAGQYAMQVWVREVGSAATYQTYKASGNFQVVSPPPPAPPAVTLARQLPPSVGVSGTFSASVTGGVAPHTFQYWVYRGSTGAWTIERPWHTSPTWVFTPTTSGQHAVQVWVRSAGSTRQYDAYLSTGFFVVAPSAVPPSTPSTPRLVASPGTNGGPGAPITWTGSSTGGAQPTQYKFWLYSAASQTWQITQDWSDDNTWVWVPSARGTYAVQVWVRSAGSTAEYQAYTSSGFFTIAP